MRWTAVSILLIACFVIGPALSQPDGTDDGQQSFLTARGERYDAASSMEFREAVYGIECSSIIYGFDRTVPDEAPWREKAREYLLECCKMLAGLPDTKPIPDLVAMGARLTDELGCDDPLVAGMHATWLGYARPADDLTDRFLAAVNGLPKTEYPAHRIALAAFTYAEWNERRGNSSYAQRIYGLRAPHTARMLRTHIGLIPVDTTSRRFIMYKLMKRLRQDFGIEAIRKLLGEIDERGPTLDPYLANVARAMCEYRLAWEARGDAFYRELSDEQRRGYAEYLDLATEHALQAHELEPELPFAALVLLEIAVEQGRTGGLTQRQWFEKAVDAEFIFPEAYTALLRGLQARWGGSPAATRAFALELASIGQYNTTVPWIFFEATEQLGCEIRDFDRVWDDPELTAAAHRIIDGYLRAETPLVAPTLCRAARGAIAWRRDRFAEAYEDLQDPEVYQAFSNDLAWRFRAHRYDIIADVLARGGPFADRAAEAAGAIAAGDRERGIKLFEEILAAVPEDQTVMRWALKNYRDSADATRALESGEWLQACFSSSIWQAYDGSWITQPDESVPDTGETVWGSVHDGRMLLRLTLPVGSRAEFEARVDLASLGDAEHARFGFVFDHGLEKYSRAWRSVQIRKNLGIVSISSFDGLRTRVDLPEHADEVTLRVAIWDGFAAVWVDGALLYRGEIPGDSWQGYGDGFGLTGWLPAPGAARCSALRIRRLVTPPSDLAPVIPGLEPDRTDAPRF